MKYIALFVSTLIALVVNFYTHQDIKVTQSIPQNIKINSTVPVELAITKGEINGFAKLEQELPDGFTALPLDMKGGAFTFDKQKIKIIWVSLPSSKEFKITYSLKVDGKGTGKKSIGGKMYFIKDNIKQINEITPSIVDVK